MTTTMTRIILSLKPEQHEWLKVESERTKRPVSWLIRDAIQEYMKAKDAERQADDAFKSKKP